MPRPRCSACHEAAVCLCPHPMCPAHAQMFYTAMVRIGSGLAELNRGAPPGLTLWERPGLTAEEVDDATPVTPPVLECWLPTAGERVCRWPACPYAARSRYGLLCAPHLQQTYREREARRLRDGRGRGMAMPTAD